MSSSFSANSGSLLILKLSRRVRLQPMTLPDAAYTGLADPPCSCPTVPAPVGSVGRVVPRRQVHHPSHHLGRDLGSSPRPWRIALQSGQAQGEEPCTPSRNFHCARAAPRSLADQDSG